MEDNRQSGLWVHPRYEYKGVSLSTHVHPRERLEAVYAYTDWRETDVVLQTYAKSGTNLCGNLYRNILEAAGITDGKSVVSCPLEIESPPEKQKRKQDPSRGPIQELVEVHDPRLLVTHIPINLLPDGIRAKQLKIINVRRNPKDVAISCFYFQKKMGNLPQDLPFNDFLDKQIDSAYIEGRQYFLHMKSWYETRDEPNVLSLQFEEMIQNLPKAVRQIAEFINVTLAEDQVDTIAAKNRFETRQAEATEFQKLFLRQGKKGSWKSVLNVAQNEKFDEWIAEGMKGMEDVQILYE